MKSALSLIIDFAFNRETDTIKEELVELKEAGTRAWSMKHYLNAFLIMIIYGIMVFGVSIISVFEYIVANIAILVRGSVLLVFALIAEILSLGVRK